MKLDIFAIHNSPLELIGIWWPRLQLHAEADGRVRR